MNKIPYNKPELSFDDTVRLLKTRDFFVDDELKVKKYLKHIGYFRLTGYFKFFQNKTTNVFQPNTSIDKVIDIYNFDRKLRLLTLDAIEKIEVSIKSTINYELYSQNGCYWHLDSSNFYLKYPWQQKIYAGLLKKIQKKQAHSSSIFVKEFFKKYSNTDLPSWMLFEELTIGEISNIYKILATSHKKKIANLYGAYYKDFESWLQVLVTLRNISAHHARLWNKDYISRVKHNDKVLAGKLKTEIHQNKTTPEVIPNYYNAFIMIDYLLNRIHKNFDWKDNLIFLFHEFPNLPIEKMGFSKSWLKQNTTLKNYCFIYITKLKGKMKT